MRSIGADPCVPGPGEICPLLLRSIGVNVLALALFSPERSFRGGTLSGKYKLTPMPPVLSPSGRGESSLTPKATRL